MKLWTLLTNSWIILVTVINPDELCFQFGWSLFFATWRRMETRSFRFICRNNIFLPAHVFTHHQFHAISHCLYQEYNKALIFFDSLLYPVFTLKDKGSLNPISPGLFGSIGSSSRISLHSSNSNCSYVPPQISDVKALSPPRQDSQLLLLELSIAASGIPCR